MRIDYNETVDGVLRKVLSNEQYAALVPERLVDIDGNKLEIEEIAQTLDVLIYEAGNRLILFKPVLSRYFTDIGVLDVSLRMNGNTIPLCFDAAFSEATVRDPEAVRNLVPANDYKEREFKADLVVKRYHSKRLFLEISKPEFIDIVSKTSVTLTQDFMRNTCKSTSRRTRARITEVDGVIKDIQLDPRYKPVALKGPLLVASLFGESVAVFAASEGTFKKINRDTVNQDKFFDVINTKVVDYSKPDKVEVLARPFSKFERSLPHEVRDVIPPAILQSAAALVVYYKGCDYICKDSDGNVTGDTEMICASPRVDISRIQGKKVYLILE